MSQPWKKVCVFSRKSESTKSSALRKKAVGVGKNHPVKLIDGYWSHKKLDIWEIMSKKQCLIERCCFFCALDYVMNITWKILMRRKCS